MPATQALAECTCARYRLDAAGARGHFMRSFWRLAGHLPSSVWLPFLARFTIECPLGAAEWQVVPPVYCLQSPPLKAGPTQEMLESDLESASWKTARLAPFGPHAGGHFIAEGNQ